MTSPHSLVAVLFAGCLLAAPIAASAQSEGSDSGLVGLSLPLGARGVGQGRAVAANGGELQALPYNPAVLVGLEGKGAATYSRFEAADLADLNSNFLAAAAVTKWGTVAVQAVYIDYGSIPVTDASPDVIGSIEVSDWSLGVSLARRWNKVAYGATARWLSADLGSVSASGPSFDAGVVYEPKETLPLALAVSLRNMGPDLDFGEGAGGGDGTEPLPGRVRVGVHYHPLTFPGLPPEYRVSLSFDIESVSRELSTSSQHAGAAVMIHDVVTVRGGLVLMDNPFASSRASNRNAGGAVGVGVRLGEFEADLAREISISELGDETHISVLYRF